MSRAISSHRFPRERTLVEHGPISHALLSLRRYVSRMSLIDAAAVLLVWGNIIGLIAYPAFGGNPFGSKPAQNNQVVNQSLEIK